MRSRRSLLEHDLVEAVDLARVSVRVRVGVRVEVGVAMRDGVRVEVAVRNGVRVEVGVAVRNGVRVRVDFRVRVRLTSLAEPMQSAVRWSMPVILTSSTEPPVTPSEVLPPAASTR